MEITLKWQRKKNTLTRCDDIGIYTLYEILKSQINLTFVDLNSILHLKPSWFRPVLTRVKNKMIFFNNNCFFSVKSVRKHMFNLRWRWWKKNSKIAYILLWIFTSIFKATVIFIKFIKKRMIEWWLIIVSID